MLDRLTIICSVQHASSYLTQSSYYLQSGLSQDNEMPTIGSIAAKIRNVNAVGLPAYVAVQEETRYGHGSYLGTQYNPQ